MDKEISFEKLTYSLLACSGGQVINNFSVSKFSLKILVYNALYGCMFYIFEFLISITNRFCHFIYTGKLIYY